MARKKRKGSPTLKKGSHAAKAFMAKLRKLRFSKGKKSGRKRVNAVKKDTLPPIVISEESTIMAKKKTSRKRRKAVSRKNYGYPVFRPKARKASRRSRRGVRMHGGLPGLKGIKPVAIITEVAGIGAGAVAGSFIAKLATRVPFLNNPNVYPFIPIILGVVLPLTKFGKSSLVKNAAAGSLAIGTIALVKKFLPSLPLLSGDEVNELLLGMEEMPSDTGPLLGTDYQTPELLGDDDALPVESVLG